MKKQGSKSCDSEAATKQFRTLDIAANNVNCARNNQQFYDGIAHEYDRSYHSASRYTDLTTKIETNFILANVVRNGRTLEVGPGQGRFTQRLAETSGSVVAADVSSKMLEICRARTIAQNVVYHHADLLALDAEQLGGMFDTIVLMWVIPHLEDGPAVLQKLLSLLKPDGRLIFDLWNSSSLRKLQHIRFNEKKRKEKGGRTRDHDWVYTRYYTYAEMLALLGQVRLTILKERGSCLIPMMNFRGRRLFFPLYGVLDESLQRPFKRYYYSRLFCCVRSEASSVSP